MTEEAIRNVIASEVKRAGSLRKLASEKGVSHSYLWDVILGRRYVSAELAEKFGFERIEKRTVQFKKIS